MNLSITKKKIILDELLKDSTVKDVKQEDNFLSFSMKKKKWYNTKYNAIILYDESGYFMKVSTGYGRSEWMAPGKTQQIIGKLKQLEVAAS